MSAPIWRDPTLLAVQEQALAALLAEDRRQLDKWGVQRHTPAQWGVILGEEFGELLKELCDAEFGVTSSNCAAEAVQLATLALKIAAMATPTVPRDG